MGSPSREAGRDEDEGPQREVRLDAFWMGAHEVMHDAYSIFRYRRLDDHVGASDDRSYDADGVTRPSPPYEDPAHGMGKEGHPAVGMTRLAALRFARWLSEKTGRLFRLPTEAEWEHACRGTGTGIYGFGDDPTRAGEHAWLDSNSSGAYHPVASKPANGWGLHDMHGNVAEWVMDEYDPVAYSTLPEEEATVNPMAGDPTGGRGVVRGGAFDDPPERLRCAERFPEARAWKARDPQIPKSRWWNTDSPHVGFRLVSPAREHTMDEIRTYWTELLGRSAGPTSPAVRDAQEE